MLLNEEMHSLGNRFTERTEILFVGETEWLARMWLLNGTASIEFFLGFGWCERRAAAAASFKPLEATPEHRRLMLLPVVRSEIFLI